MSSSSQHGSGVVTVYGHLSRFAPKLRRGQRVQLGQIIAYRRHRPASRPARICTTNIAIRGVHKNPQTVPLPDAAPITSARDATVFLTATADLVNMLDLPAGPALVAR